MIDDEDADAEFDWWTNERFDEAWANAKPVRLIPQPGIRIGPVVDVRIENCRIER